MCPKVRNECQVRSVRLPSEAGTKEGPAAGENGRKPTGIKTVASFDDIHAARRFMVALHRKCFLRYRKQALKELH